MEQLMYKIGHVVEDVCQGKGKIIGIDLANEENRALEPYLVKFESGYEFWLSEEDISAGRK